jgi:hypothetical protein
MVKGRECKGEVYNQEIVDGVVCHSWMSWGLAGVVWGGRWPY